MHQTKVVNLSKIRELLRELDEARRRVVNGSLSGWQTTLRDEQGRDTVFLGGIFSENPQAAIPALLNASAERRFGETDPPPFQASQM